MTGGSRGMQRAKQGLIFAGSAASGVFGVGGGLLTAFSR